MMKSPAPPPAPYTIDLISTQPQDSERKSVIINRTKYSVITPSRVLALSAIFIASLGAPFAFAEAGVFSYLNREKSEAALVSAGGWQEPQNSQNIAFLESSSSFDPKKAMGGGDITVVDDSAFVSDIGSSGVGTDVDLVGHQGKVTLYVVRSGDTITGVAKMFGVSVNTIIWANDISRGAALREGQHLVILPIDGVQHTVKKGDTLQNIAKKYKGDVGDIALFNDISINQKLSVGDVVIVPNGKEEQSSPAANPSAPSPRARIFSQYPSYIGYYTHPVPEGHKTQGIHGYNGVDYGAPLGTPVYAAAEGTVIVSNFRSSSCGRSCGGGYGNYIVVEHNNDTQTLYGHLSAVFTSVGGHVDKGQQIGEVGNTGKSSGAHLHFEVRGAKNPF